MKTLVLGAIKSGKSLFAEQLATKTNQHVTYIATATIGDADMQNKVDLHKQRRPERWALIEEPMQLIQALQANAKPDHCLLVDCLTLWITNLLCSEESIDLDQALLALPDSLSQLPGDQIFVSNESGLGVIPDNQLSRQYLELSGRLHQAMAEACDNVILIIAGLPQVLKGENPQ